MECERARSMLPGYIDGDLPERLAQETERHLQVCRVCADEAAGLEWLLSATRRAMDCAGLEDGLTELTRRLDAFEAARRQPYRRTWVGLGVVLGRLFAASVVAVLLAAALCLTDFTGALNARPSSADTVETAIGADTPDELLQNNILWRRGLRSASTADYPGASRLPVFRR